MNTITALDLKNLDAAVWDKFLALQQALRDKGGAKLLLIFIEDKVSFVIKTPHRVDRRKQKAWQEGDIEVVILDLHALS